MLRSPDAFDVSNTYLLGGMVDFQAMGSLEIESKDYRILGYGYTKEESFEGFLGQNIPYKASLSNS
jgi:hypothetical protein